MGSGGAGAAAGCQERSGGDSQPRLPPEPSPDLELSQSGERDDERVERTPFREQPAVLIIRT